ncbi:MAG: DUF481 domain-containing protein [Pseudomonadota bacterium]
MAKKRCFFIAWALLLALPAALSADTLSLDNGDRITGTLVRAADGKVLFRTDWGKDVTVPAGRVARLTTDAPVYVEMPDGTTASGRVFGRTAGSGNDFSLTGAALIQPEAPPAVVFSGRANAGVSSEKGNTDTEKLNLDADLVARTRHQRYNVGGEYDREFADDIKTADNWTGYGSARHYMTRQWYGYGSARFEHDELADLDLRTTLGAGAGYQFFESKDLNLSASAGAAWVKTAYGSAPEDDFPSAQWAIHYDQYFFGRAFQLFHRQDGFVGLEDANQWAVKTRQGVRVPITRGFNATLQYNYDWNNAPSPKAREKWDSKIMFLLGYAFGP